MTMTYDFEVGLSYSEADHLVKLIEWEVRRIDKSLAKARRLPGQSEGDFREFVDGLSAKKIWLLDIVRRLQDEDA